jgi:all-trans-retinol dehydrogenase (NAD+)
MSKQQIQTTSDDKFSASKRRKLLWRYIKTNIIIGFMLTFEFWRGVFNLFIPKRPKCIKDKLALITGGGHGIGRELAFKMAAKGCHIVIADIDIAAATTTTEEIARLHNVKTAAFKVDVSRHAEVKQLKKDIEATIGCVDLLVNNVGLLALDVSLREQTPERVQQVVNVNMMSHFWVNFQLI